MQMPTPALPVIAVSNREATTYREYPASLEGKVNVEIRAQVDGYLENIYVDEGAYVKKGQSLFRINDRPYREQLANAQASLLAAQANMEKAQLEVDRLAPLVKNNVVSEVQLKTAEASLQTAKANVAQARAQVSNAQIDLGYTLIKAPVDGYIGRIPFKSGSLVGRGEEQPLTVLSDINEVYAYFSMSEVDFLQFKELVPGNTLEEKIKNLPPVEVVLADGNAYAEKGRIETVEGQFDNTMGSISFRAVFPNSKGLLRSGNTGRIRIPRQLHEAMVIPQEATFEIQDKVFVFALGDSNKVVGKPITIQDRTANYYFVNGGVKSGDKIVFAGHGNLRDGMVIEPQLISADSLLKVNPL
jgi:membrane fusion protein (multidrug efflux system)